MLFLHVFLSALCVSSLGPKRRWGRVAAGTADEKKAAGYFTSGSGHARVKRGGIKTMLLEDVLHARRLTTQKPHECS